MADSRIYIENFISIEHENVVPKAKVFHGGNSK